MKITAVDDAGKAIALGEQSVTVTGGSRSNPTRMSFAKEGDSLISDKAFPEGNNLPVIVQIKATPDAKTVIEKFTLNLSDCPVLRTRRIRLHLRPRRRGKRPRRPRPLRWDRKSLTATFCIVSWTKPNPAKPKPIRKPPFHSAFKPQRH